MHIDVSRIIYVYADVYLYTYVFTYIEASVSYISSTI